MAHYIFFNTLCIPLRVSLINLEYLRRSRSKFHLCYVGKFWLLLFALIIYKQSFLVKCVCLCTECLAYFSFIKNMADSTSENRRSISQGRNKYFFIVTFLLQRLFLLRIINKTFVSLRSPPSHFFFFS